MVLPTPLLHLLDQSSDSVRVSNIVQGASTSIFVNGNKFAESFKSANDEARVSLGHKLSPGDQIQASQQTSNDQSAIRNPVFVENNNVTQHYDVERTGWNPYEKILNPNNLVKFTKLFEHDVDGHVYGQPLYVQNVLVDNQFHNLIFVVTETNKVYSFDADDSNNLNASPIWYRDLNQGHAQQEGPVSNIDIPADGVHPYPCTDIEAYACCNCFDANIIMQPVVVWFICHQRFY
jgi:hypothetical protein